MPRKPRFFVAGVANHIIQKGNNKEVVFIRVLVSSLIYLTRKLHEASKKYARKRIVEDINVIRKELKVAGELLSFFIDQEIKNETSFGKVRKKHSSFFLKRK